jgi:hypothetical protein
MISSRCLSLICAALLGAGVAERAGAQEIRELLGGPGGLSSGRGSFRGWSRDMKEGLQGDHTGWSFCRLAYASVTRESGGQGWTTDYPLAEQNLMFRAEELTTIGMAKYPDGKFAYSIVFATSPDLYRCPFLFASDVGTMGLTDEEIAALQQYLDKGGFIWVDDFWGERAWRRFQGELLKIIPDLALEQVRPGAPALVDLTPDHPMLSAMYRVKRIPQIPSIQQWLRMGAGAEDTSERGADSRVPHMRAVYDDKGRMMVLITHNTDIADGWEREGEDQEYFYLFSPEAYAIAVNVLVWVMTH